MEDKLFDEKIYYRVTDVLKNLKSLDHVPKKILEYAADRGKRVHKYCELYCLDQLDECIDDDCFPYVQAFIDFFDDNVEQVLLLEKRLKCDFLKIQGQFDMIAKLKDYDNACIIDIKTCYNECRTWPIQLAAYQHLCAVNSNEDECLLSAGVDFLDMNRVVLRVNNKSEHATLVYKQESFLEAFQAFKSTLEIHRYFEKNLKKQPFWG